MIETGLLHYGYLFVFLGAIVEGDATLLTASFLAHRGYFRLSWVIALAALATVGANQIYYAVARRHGPRWLESSAFGGPRAGKIASWARQRGGLLLLASRFLIGFRTIVPAVCGAMGMAPLAFFAWNAAGAAVWALAFGAAGYFGAHALAVLLEDLRRHERAIAAALAVGSAAFILWRTRGRDLIDLWHLRTLFKRRCRVLLE